MVKYKPDELIEVADCCRAVYLLDANEFPPHLLPGVLAFNAERSAELFEFGRVLRTSDYRLVNTEMFEVVSELDMDVPAPYYLEPTKIWLRALGITASEQVYVNWGSSGAVATEWGIVCEQFDDFVQPFDIVNVFDETLKWGVLFGPEEWVVFVQEMGEGPHEEGRSVGAGLIRCKWLWTSRTLP